MLDIVLLFALWFWFSDSWFVSCLFVLRSLQLHLFGCCGCLLFLRCLLLLRCCDWLFDGLYYVLPFDLWFWLRCLVCCVLICGFGVANSVVRYVCFFCILTFDDIGGWVLFCFYCVLFGCRLGCF